MSAARGSAALEGGLNWPAALTPVTWMTGVMIFTTLLPSHESASSAQMDPLWLTLLVMSPIAILLIGTMLWFFYRPYHPRRLSGLADLDRFPPGRDGKG